MGIALFHANAQSDGFQAIKSVLKSCKTDSREDLENFSLDISTKCLLRFSKSIGMDQSEMCQLLRNAVLLEEAKQRSEHPQPDCEGKTC